MDRAPNHDAAYRVSLSASAERVPAGHPLLLAWQVADSETAVSYVQLACASEHGLETIESLPQQGSRLVILARPGTLTFTLSATFGDGVKRRRQIRVRVSHSAIND